MIEVKSGRTINSHFFDSLRYFQPLAEAMPEESFLIYGGNEVQNRSIARVLGWQHLENIPL